MLPLARSRGGRHAMPLLAQIGRQAEAQGSVQCLISTLCCRACHLLSSRCFWRGLLHQLRLIFTFGAACTRRAQWLGRLPGLVAERGFVSFVGNNAPDVGSRQAGWNGDHYVRPWPAGGMSPDMHCDAGLATSGRGWQGRELKLQLKRYGRIWTKSMKNACSDEFRNDK
jgi:hypothetical protein